MAKTKISEFSSTPGNNTDIDSINIAEGCAPSGINNAIRELMAQLKDFQTGAVGDSFNGPIGTTTAAAGAFTTLTTSGAVTHNAGTANGVAFLNGSKVLTTGSALTFDGTNLGIGGTAAVPLDVYANSSALNLRLRGRSADSIGQMEFWNNAGSTRYGYLSSESTAITLAAGTSVPLVFVANAAEQMRLTSTGLGIGTSSPGRNLTINATIPILQFTNPTSGTTANDGLLIYQNGLNAYFSNQEAGAAIFETNNAERMRLDSSGNLGLGVTPSANTIAKAFELQNGFNLFSAFNIGYINANAYFDSNWKYKNTAASGRYEVADSHKWYTAPSGTAGNAISFTQAMTLTAGGELSVASTGPIYSSANRGNITIGGSASSLLFLGTGGTTGSYVAHFQFNNSLEVWNGADGPTIFATKNLERARIDSSGNLLWQKTAVSSGTTGITFENDGANTARLSIGGANSSSATGLSLYSTTAGAFRFFVSYSGQINATNTSITAISDATLKENVRDLETGLTEVMALRPRRFDWREETQLPDRNVAGFIAQEVEQVLPELVYDYKYSADATKKSLKMGDILPTLVKAIQEQQAIITALTARITALESN